MCWNVKKNKRGGRFKDETETKRARITSFVICNISMSVVFTCTIDCVFYPPMSYVVYSWLSRSGMLGHLRRKDAGLGGGNAICLILSPFDMYASACVCVCVCVCVC